MTPIQALYRLQEIELRLLRGQKRLVEIDAALANSQAKTMALEQFTRAQSALSPLQTRVRSLELEIQSTNDKIRETDQQLYSGRVRNPKELQDMQMEIQSLKKHTADLEDQLLETMLAVEEAEGTVAAAQRNLEAVTADWENQNQQLLDEQARLKAEQVVLSEQRQQALAAVDPEGLKLYNALKPRKNHQPVALLDGESCSACGVEQTMAIVSEVRRGQSLVSCLSCGRILVYK